MSNLFLSLATLISQIVKYWASTTQYLPEQRQKMIEVGHSIQKEENFKTKKISKPKLRVLARRYAKSIKSTSILPVSVSKVKIYDGEELGPIEARTLTNEKFKHYLSESVEMICCPICRCEIIEPVKTRCEHIFCLQCIENTMLLSNRCPICREVLFEIDKQGPGFSKGVQSLISLVNSKIEPKNHLNHLQEYTSWKNKRFVSTQEVMSSSEVKLDVMNSEGKWKKAVVVDQYLNEKRVLEEILVRYEDDVGSTFSEVVNFESLRVARYGFYTNRQEEQYSYSNFLSLRRQNVLSESVTFPETMMTNTSLERESPQRDDDRPFIIGLQTNEEGRDFLLRSEIVVTHLEPPSDMSFVESEYFSSMSQQDRHFLQEQEENI